MKVREIMTSQVMTVGPDTPVPALASLFASRGISGVPVVDGTGQLVGLVTEGDLLRQITGEEEAQSWFRRLIESAPSQALQYVQSHGRVARDLMTTSLETVGEDDSIQKAAGIMAKRNIRRLPVVRDGKLVGILSRADLMKAIVAPPAQAPGETSDAEIERKLVAEMRRHSWADAYYIFPHVEKGTVQFHGFCNSDDVERGLRVLAEGIPGVKGVTFDLSPVPPPMLA